MDEFEVEFCRRISVSAVVSRGGGVARRRKSAQRHSKNTKVGMCVWQFYECVLVRRKVVKRRSGRLDVVTAVASLGCRPCYGEIVSLCFLAAADIEARRSTFLRRRIMARSRNTWAILMNCHVLFTGRVHSKQLAFVGSHSCKYRCSAILNRDEGLDPRCLY